MSRTQKPYIDYANLGDDGTDTTGSIQPPTYEPATPTNFGRPHQNIRSRTEIVRSALADLFYYADRSRYTLELAGSGQLEWETAGVGRANNTDTLTLRPFLGPRANVKGLLTIGTAGTNQLLYTVQSTVYASDGINAVTVEHRHVAATVTPLATVTAGPVYRILVVFDNTNVGHTATVVAPIVAAAIASSTYLNGKIVVTADDTPGNAILGTTGEVAIDTRVHPAGTAGQATADLEAHVLAVGEIGSFTTTYPLAEGDGLAIRYDYLVESSADPDDPKAGVPGGRAESNAARANTNVVGNLFRMNDYPEWLPGAIPLCKVVRGRLHWCDNTVQATNTAVTPGLDSAALVYPGGGAWADGTTNPATTIVAQLTKIISDLAATTGAAKLGMVARPNWFDGTTNPVTRLDQAVYKIIADLADSAGARKIGAQAQSSGSAAVTLGSVYTQTGQMLALLDGLRTDLDNRSLQAAYDRSVALGQVPTALNVGAATALIFRNTTYTQAVTFDLGATPGLSLNALQSRIRVKDGQSPGTLIGIRGPVNGGGIAFDYTLPAGGLPFSNSLLTCDTTGQWGYQETALLATVSAMQAYAFAGAYVPAITSVTGANLGLVDVGATQGTYTRLSNAIQFSITLEIDATAATAGGCVIVLPRPITTAVLANSFAVSASVSTVTFQTVMVAHNSPGTGLVVTIDVTGASGSAETVTLTGQYRV